MENGGKSVLTHASDGHAVELLIKSPIIKTQSKRTDSASPMPKISRPVGNPEMCFYWNWCRWQQTNVFEAIIRVLLQFKSIYQTKSQEQELWEVTKTKQKLPLLQVTHFSFFFSVLLFTQVNLDKLYVLAVNYVFKKNLLPLLMDPSKKIQHLGPSKELSSVTQSIFKHALCIQNLELAAATIHKIAQDLPAGESGGMTAPKGIMIK